MMLIRQLLLNSLTNDINEMDTVDVITVASNDFVFADVCVVDSDDDNSTVDVGNW